MTVSCFLSAGTSSSGVKYRGTVEVFNLSEENDMDDLDVSQLPVPDVTYNYVNHTLIDRWIDDHIDYNISIQISVSLCKDQPNTPLLDLMKKSGVQEVRRVLGDYVRQLKSGMLSRTNQSVMVMRIPVT